MARALGVNDRGYFALLTLVPVIAVQIGGMGFTTGLTSYLARGNDPRAGWQAVRLPLAIQAAVGVGASWLALSALTEGAPSRVHLALILALLLVPSGLMLNYGVALLQGLREFRSLSIIRLLPATVNSLAIAGAYLFGARSIVWVMSVWVTTSALVSIVALAAGVSRVRHKTDETVHAKQARLWPIAAFGLRAFIGASSPVETFRLDQAVVGVLLSARVLGLYVVALAFTNFPRFIGQAVGYVAYPEVARQRSQAGQQMRAVWQYVAVGGGITLAAVVCLELSAGSLVKLLFGTAFAEAVPITRVLLVAALLASVRRLLSDIAQGASLPGISSIAEIVSWAVLAPALLLLTPTYGTTGAALAMTLAYGASTAILAIRLSPVWPCVEVVPQRLPELCRRIRKGATWIAAAGVLAACGGLITVIPASTEPDLLLTVAIATTLLAPVLLRMVRRRFDPFEPTTLFALAWGVMFVLRPIVMITQHDYVYSRPTRAIDVSSTLTETLIFGLLGAVFFVIGYAIPAGPDLRPALVRLGRRSTKNA